MQNLQHERLTLRLRLLIPTKEPGLKLSVMNGTTPFYLNGLKIKILSFCAAKLKPLVTVRLQQVFMFYRALCWPGFGPEAGQLLAFSVYFGSSHLWLVFLCLLSSGAPGMGQWLRPLWRERRAQQLCPCLAEGNPKRQRAKLSTQMLHVVRITFLQLPFF